MSDDEVKNKLLTLRCQVDAALACLASGSFRQDLRDNQIDRIPDGALFAVGDFIVYPREY